MNSTFATCCGGAPLRNERCTFCGESYCSTGVVPWSTKLETEIRTEIVEALKRGGALPIIAWQGPLAKRGISDLLICDEGRFVSVEVKKPGGRPSKEQQKFLQEVRASGGTGFVAYSAEDVISRLNLAPRIWPLLHWRQKCGS